MKVILYNATSINGFIAKSDYSVEWTDEEWSEYKRLVNEKRVLIIGRHTYDIMRQDKEFAGLHVKVVVISRSIPKSTPDSNVIFFDDDLDKILDYLEIEGYKEAVVAGGKQINSLFLEKGYVDEVILDVEPFLYGNGIALANESDFDYELQLINVKKLSSRSIQLHYKVKK